MRTAQLDQSTSLDEAYLKGWRAWNRGDSYAAARRRFANHHGGEHLVEAWADGWADAQHGRPFGAAKGADQ